MRNFIFAFISIFIIFLSCQTEPEINSVSISGTIENPASEQVVISIDEQEYLDTLKDGSFNLEFDIDESAFFKFRHGSEYADLYLSPGDVLLMTLDANEFDESIQYEGKGSIANNYLAKEVLHEEEVTDGVSFKDLYSKDQPSFIDEVNSIFDQKLEFLSDFSKNNSMSSDFTKLAKADIEINRAKRLMMYADYHMYYTEKTGIENSQAIIEKVSEIELDNPDLLKLRSFSGFLPTYLINSVDPEVIAEVEDEDEKYLASYSAALDLIPAKIKDQKIRDLAAEKIMNFSFAFGYTDYTPSMVDRFNEICKDQKMLETINSLNEQWLELAKGNQAPGFKYANLEGEEIALADMQGKAVYIDVWATWCGPCIKEIPHLEELQEKYADDDRIIFTSISIDENKEAWEKMVKKKELKGVQLIADNAWDSEIVKDYLIEGIPRFILIDAEGNIVNASAPRPSSIAIKNLLEITLNGKTS